MRQRSEYGSGCVRTVKDRVTGKVIGYRALLPREFSKPPKRCKNPGRYQQPIGDVFPSRGEARRLLNAVIVELQEKARLREGLDVSWYVKAEIDARHNAALRDYRHKGRASRRTATWKSIDRNWLQSADFYNWLPTDVRPGDLQAFIDYLKDEARSEAGDPLSGSFIRQVGSLLKSTFKRCKLETNPALELELPAKGAPRVVHLDLPSQLRLFRSQEIELSDRVMVGCGMGPGLRVGELLSFEPEDVHVDHQDPHLIVRYGGPNHAPPKGRRIRRVELFEPGLGFWRLWMERFYAGGRTVFAGPNGGYLKQWPEQFPGWATIAGVDRLSSHIMRHTYAVAVLSGTWGYEPKSLEFVSDQLGHRDRQTTERYYKAFEGGTWQREVRRMTGREARPSRGPVTAQELLGSDAQVDDQEIEPEPYQAVARGKRVNSRHSPKDDSGNQKDRENAGKTGPFDGVEHQSLATLGKAALELAAAGDPSAVARLIEFTSRALPTFEAAERAAAGAAALLGKAAAS